MRQWLLRLLAFASAMTVVPFAGAHAFLDYATPAVGSAVHGSPDQVKLWFTQQIEPAFSTARVLDRDGRQIDKGDPRIDRVDATLLSVSLPKLAPGTYRVEWRVLSVDTHVTEGDYTFDVVP